MNWQDVIKKISEEFPQLTPEKLYDYVKKTYGSESDIKLLEKEWTRLVVRSIKNFKGVPDTEDRKKLSLNKRINYFIESPGFKWSWQLFHSQYYNDGPQPVCDEDGNPTGEIIENFMGLGPKDISDKDFRAIDHNRNITRILQRANFKK